MTTKTSDGADARVIDLPLQTRAEVRIEPATVDVEARTVELVWSTGAAVRRRDLWTGKRYDEVLSLDPAHVDLSRLNGGAPLLNSHGMYDLADVIGVVERAWIARSANGASEGRAVVRFSDRAEVEPVWRDVQAGILHNVSVGYQVRAFEITEEEGKTPVWRAVDWQPMELSAVPVGADAGAGFRQGPDTFACRLTVLPNPETTSTYRAQRAPNPEKAMDETEVATTGRADERPDPAPTEKTTETRSATGDAPDEKPLQAKATEGRAGDKSAARAVAVPESVVAPSASARSSAALAEPQHIEPGDRSAENGRRAVAPTDDDAMRAVAERAVSAERERSAGIYEASRKLGIDSGVADDLVRRGVALDTARRVLIDHAAERDQAVETRPQVRMGGLDETVTRRQAVEAALLHRFDPHRYALTEPARDWRGLSLLEMARTFLEAEGGRARGLSRNDVATRALHSTSDFPEILAAVTNKTLRDAYEAAPRTFQPIARRVEATDFKPMHRLQLGEAPQLEKVNQSGEYKRGTMGEAKESYRVETYGKVIAITRQVIINDDLDAFTRIPALFGTSAATLESDVVWSIITANPAMGDGKALFHADHKNLAGTGTALDVTNLGKGRTAMAKQTGVDGKTILNVRPAFLVVPSALELTAEQLVAQNLVPAKSGDVVPGSIRSLTVIAEPRLDPAAGAVPWYLFASPSAVDTIEYAYLEGQDGVYIETRIGFDVDGVEVKARLDFGAKAIDWRSMYKNGGVAL
ncbi:MAG: prohead protease/major capsid protein fusion protein [Alphaproteobacteria bacterium]